jgi:hypothetical protein
MEQFHGDTQTPPPNGAGRWRDGDIRRGFVRRRGDGAGFAAGSASACQQWNFNGTSA